MLHRFLAGLAAFFVVSAPVAGARAQTDRTAGPVFNMLAGPVRERLSSCGVGPAELEALIALPPQAFDQDFEGGWRAVSYDDGCLLAAADLIKAYILYSRPFPASDELRLLRWHAGQMMASANAYAEAIALMSGTHDAPEDGETEWNLYVDGTLAFLRSDRDALLQARDELAGRTVPEDVQAARRRFLADNPNITMPDGFVDEPANLSVLDGLLTCFEAPYSQAYGRQCQTAR